MTEVVKRDRFQSAWRPALGWVGFSAICFQYLIRPVFTLVMAYLGKQMPEMTWLDNSLWELVALTLGTATLRSYDKMKRTVG